MRLATFLDGSADGRLHVISRDGTRATDASVIAPTLLDAVERWDRVRGLLENLAVRLDADRTLPSRRFDPSRCLAPLPRCWQWCDAAAFLNFGRLSDKAFGTPPMPDAEIVPLVHQGAGDDFLGPCDDVPLPSEDDGIDFEGEFGVIVSEVPMGIDPASALRHVVLVVLLNDWTLRALAPRELRSGYGYLQAKPATAFAPLAVTIDGLGPAWRDGRVHLDLDVEWNGERFGHPNGGEMGFHFGELIAHAARSRRLSAGTIIGSGVVSNADPGVGSACVAERRVVEIIEDGAASTSFLSFGDRVRMEARWPDGAAGPFGAIDQRVVRAR